MIKKLKEWTPIALVVILCLGGLILPLFTPNYGLTPSIPIGLPYL